jgi:hypothetical protein
MSVVGLCVFTAAIIMLGWFSARGCKSISNNLYLNIELKRKKSTLAVS